ncbi:MAG: hypothetical protein ACYCX2_03260 [Christensenellales bacterium]
MGNKKKICLSAVYYGSIWGMMEAVLGYILHFIPFGLSGMVMFPAGFCCMMLAYKRSGTVRSIFYTGLVAAVIKLADLFLPFLPLIRILMPSAAILLEATTAAAAVAIFKNRKNRTFAGGVLFVCIGWRLLFLLMQYVMTLFLIPSGLIDGGMQSILPFILLEGSVNAAIILLVMMAARKSFTNQNAQRIINPAATAAMLTVSVAATIAASLL